MISIGELAKRADCSVPTIRYYEQVGLMPKAGRRTGGHRAYERKDLARLNLIRRCRDCDIPLDRIRELLALGEGGKPCAETSAFFEAQRGAIQARIKALRDLDLSLSLMLGTCDSACGDDGVECLIFDTLEAS